MFLTCETHVSQQSLPLAICDKTTTNKWTYKRSHESLNSYSLVEYNKIYPNTNSWKICKKRVYVDNLYFWNTLNKTHQGILLWKRNNILHTSNKKHVHKEVKKKNTCKYRWKNIHQYIKNISTMYVKMVTRPLYKR